MKALVLLAALTATPDRSYPCWLVRLYVNSHKPAEVEAFIRKYKVTDKERRDHAACLKK